jgi:transposase
VGAAAPPDDGDPGDPIAQAWARLETLLPAPRRSGRQVVHDRRHILDAIVYVLQTDCGWSGLPSRFPPWKTVHNQYVTWRKAGIWSQIWAGLSLPGTRPLGQLQL